MIDPVESYFQMSKGQRHMTALKFCDVLACCFMYTRDVIRNFSRYDV